MSDILKKEINIDNETEIYDNFMFSESRGSWKWYESSRINILSTEVGNYTKTLYFYNNPTNCKLFIVDGLNNLDDLQRYNSKYFDMVIKILDSKPNSTFYVHVTSKSSIDILSRYFIPVSIKKVFIRGTSTPQYHGLFMSKRSVLRHAFRTYQKNDVEPIITKKELLRLTSYKQEKRKNEFLEKLIKRYE